MENLNLPEEQSTSEMITNYASIIWRWSWLLVLLAILAGAGAYYWSSQQTPVYQASTLIMINNAPGIQSDAYSLYMAQQSMATYAQTMTTRPMREAVAGEMGLESVPGSIQVQIVANTTLMRIVVQGADPTQVALVANTMFNVFAQQLQADQSTRYADSKASLESQLAAVQQQIQDTTAALVDIGQKVQDTQTALNLINQRIADITEVSGLAAVSQEDLDQQTQQQSTLLQYQLQQTQLQNIYSQYQNSNFSLIQSYGQVKLAEAQSTSLVIQKEPAIAPGSPTQPKPLNTAMLGAAAGLGLGLLVILLIEFLDDTIRDPQEISSKWGVPVLGIISRFNSSDNALVTIQHPRAPASEAFRALRTNLEFSAVDAPLRTILVTSPSPQDGKSTIAANLACVIAQSGHNVVVMDADLRRPQIHKHFHLTNRMGLTNKLVQPRGQLQGSIQSTELDHLKVITSGLLPPDPSELLGSGRMQELLSSLEGLFDYIIIDSPPVLMVTDAVVLAARVNGVIVVVKPSVTNRKELHHLIDRMRQVNARLLGVVLNDVDVGRARFYKYRRYYSSYKYKYDKGYYSQEAGARKEKSVVLPGPRKDRTHPPQPASPEETPLPPLPADLP